MTNLLILLIVIVIGFGIVIYILNKKLSSLQRNSSDATMLEWLKSMQTSLESTNKTLNTALSSNTDQMVRTLQENSKQLNERLDKAATVIAWSRQGSRTDERNRTFYERVTGIS